MAYLEQVKIQDGTTLYSGTISATGTTTIVDTQYYGSVSIQVAGAIRSFINAQVEGSNDQSDWDILLLNSTSDVSITDTINSTDDTFTLNTSHRYIRINVAQFTGSPIITIVGRSGTGPNAADKLTAAFNPDTPLNVKFGVGVKQDAFGALILSDGIPYLLQGSNTFIINLDGYSTIILQLSSTQTVTATQSIDGTFWTATSFYLNSGASVSTTPNAAGLWSGPVLGKYLRVVISGAVAGPTQVSVMLKNTPMNSTYFNTGITPVNLVQYSGTAIAGTGTAGQMAVGGVQVAGGAASAFPIAVAGADPGNLIRNIKTDVVGRLALSPGSYLTGYNPGAGFSATANTNAANVASLGIATAQQSPQNIPTLAVQDQTQYEGQSHVELLAQILIEMKIMNQQLYELPKILSLNITNSDTPEQLRADPTIFNTNNFN
jgi:hypothetical protein